MSSEQTAADINHPEYTCALSCKEKQEMWHREGEEGTMSKCMFG